eukprot:5383963-Pyramimonas_sp.AAC.1
MTGQDGNDETDRQSIADIFATFHEQLYRQTDSNNGRSTHGCRPPVHCREDLEAEVRPKQIPPFTQKEIHQTTKELKHETCKTTAEITAEMLKAGGPRIEQHLQ